MKRSFCRALCALLCCVLLLDISACAKQDSASSEPPVETQQTETIAETEGEKGQGQPLSEEETTYRKDETYHFKETSTHDNIEEIVDNVFRSDDDSFVKGTYERHYSERYTVKGTRVANGDGTFTQTGTIRDEDGHLESSWELVYADENASNAPRNADMIIQQDAYGNIVSVCGSNETQNEDINPEYFTENWKDNRKPYNTHQVEDRNVNMISFRDLMNLHDGNGELIRVFDDSFIWNDDGSITSTNSAEYFQAYDGCSKGYKVRSTSKNWADGTTSELQEVVHDCDENGALIRIFENEFIWNDDGSITSTNSAEYFQDYEDYLKGYKMNQITKTRADGTTSESIGDFTEPDGINTKEHYIRNEDGTEETHIETRKDGSLIRIMELNHVQNADGGTTSIESAEYFQDYEDYLKGYKMNQITKTRADGTTSELISYFTEPDGSKVVESTIRNDDGTEETWNIKHYDEKEALIWFQEVNTMWNADGSTTRTDFVEYLQDYEDILKGYKLKQITKTRADGTTYEFHEEYTYPDGICYKSGFTTNANGAKENYFEEWKDGKKVSK